tara:strand:- start:4 stop:663 length:660 start_codon:yes stop_codon:yes gene_type:complete
MNKELFKRILSALFLIPVSFFFIVKGSHYLLFYLSIIFLIISYEWYNLSKNNNLLKVLGILFLILSFFSAYFLRINFGLSIFMIVITICIFTDVGGYMFGKIFKGPKLIKISPNKTYAGMVGSFVLSTLSILIFIKYLKFFSLNDTLLELNKSNLHYIFIILLISAISQIGDLIISYFKRLAKVKNTGKLLPGHGGLLDRFDGIIFAIPTSYVLIKYLI